MSKLPLIFFSVWIALQFLSYNLARVLMWQTNIRNNQTRRWLLGLILLVTNSLMLASFFRLFKEIFRISTLWMVCLWFVFLATMVVVIIGKLLRRSRITRYQNVNHLNHDMRILAPIVLISLFGLSWYNAYVPIVKHITINIDKPLSKPIRVGMIADTHLGIMMGARQLDKLANILNQEQVDLVLIPGDIMDDDTIAYRAENMQPHLQKIHAPLGVYATLGNHDVRNSQAITAAVEAAGIKVLHDTAVLIDNRVWVVGRPDTLDKTRLTTQKLLQQTNTQQPIFLLDHRPDSVETHANLPIDLQVSGHVHNGQIFPGNLVVRLLSQIHYGYKKINHTHFVVTSGYGFWGVPFRLASQAEVWIITVKGKN